MVQNSKLMTDNLKERISEPYENQR